MTYEEFIVKFNKEGELSFYKFLLFKAIEKISEIKNCDNIYSINMEYLDYHDKFMILYRRDGNETYLTMAKVFRRAGNKIYRYCLKQGICNHNDKFLNLIKCK